ncbi:MAG: dethiobiotin synthase [Flammeovirgaceae bacterium]
METQQYIVAGIGTEVGKTVISAILVEKLQADYWKPVQAGDLDHTDTNKVSSWVSNTQSVFHRERYRLHTPMSPHAAAAIDGVSIQLSDFELPQTTNNLIVELAGGLMVPLNHQQLIVDLVAQLNLPVILVSNYYLGSINHTLLSIDLLKSRAIPIKGIIFNGTEVPTTKEVILDYSQLPHLGSIPQGETPNQEMIKAMTAHISLD